MSGQRFQNVEEEKKLGIWGENKNSGNILNFPRSRIPIKNWIKGRYTLLVLGTTNFFGCRLIGFRISSFEAFGGMKRPRSEQ